MKNLALSLFTGLALTSFALLQSCGSSKSSTTTEAQKLSYFQQLNNDYSMAIVANYYKDGTTLESLKTATMQTGSAAAVDVSGQIVVLSFTPGTSTGNSYLNDLNHEFGATNIDSAKINAFSGDVKILKVHVPTLPAGSTTFHLTFTLSDSSERSIDVGVSTLSAANWATTY